MAFPLSIFKFLNKYASASKEFWVLLESDAPTLDLHGINSDSAGITTSCTRNPPVEWLFRREVLANGWGIHLKNVYSAGNYQLREEWDSAGSCQLIDEESTRGRVFHREITAHLCWFRPVRSKCEENPPNGNNSRISSSKSPRLPWFLKNLIEKTSLKWKKPDPNFISYLSN
jgi:hypothetical protein